MQPQLVKSFLDWRLVIFLMNQFQSFLADLLEFLLFKLKPNSLSYKIPHPIHDAHSLNFRPQFHTNTGHNRSILFAMFKVQFL